MKNVKVGVFPLRDMILFPHTSLPLIIQDTNYQKMISDSQKYNFPIALGLGDIVGDTHPFGQKLLRPKEIAGLGVCEVKETYLDGSQYVAFNGIGKVKIGPPIHQVPYLLCEAEIIHDTPSHETKLISNPISRLEATLRGWLKQNIDDPYYLDTLLKKIVTVDQIINHLCLYMVRDREIKQILLESTSLVHRIQTLDLLLPSQNLEREMQSRGEVIKRFEYDDRLFGTNH